MTQAGRYTHIKASLCGANLSPKDPRSPHGCRAPVKHISVWGQRLTSQPGKSRAIIPCHLSVAVRQPGLTSSATDVIGGRSPQSVCVTCQTGLGLSSPLLAPNELGVSASVYIHWRYGCAPLRWWLTQCSFLSITYP